MVRGKNKGTTGRNLANGKWGKKQPIRDFFILTVISVCINIKLCTVFTLSYRDKFLLGIPLLQIRVCSQVFRWCCQPPPSCSCSSLPARRGRCTHSRLPRRRGRRGRGRQGGGRALSPPLSRHTPPRHGERTGEPSSSSSSLPARRWRSTRTRRSSQTTGSPLLNRKIYFYIFSSELVSIYIIY